MKLRNRVYSLSGGVYGKLGNVYAIQHTAGYLLIDAGTPDAYDTLVENLNYWGIDVSEITHVLLTHGHDDHAGCAQQLQANGAKILVGKADAYMLETGMLGEHTPFKNHKQPIVHPDICIEEDTHMTIGDVEIDIYTMPGHTDGTLLFYVLVEEESILFSGDMFFCDGERGDLASTGWKGDIQYNGTTLGQSFSKLWDLQLTPTMILGGHGNPRIGKDAKDSIMIAYKYYLLNNR